MLTYCTLSLSYALNAGLPCDVGYIHYTRNLYDRHIRWNTAMTMRQRHGSQYHERGNPMSSVSIEHSPGYLEQAGRTGHRFALEHPCADGATAMLWARRLPTKAEARAFFKSWKAAQ